MKIPLGVVMGGKSAEHEISLRSGHEVLHNIDRAVYDVRAIVITGANRYYYRDLGPDTALTLDEIASLDTLPAPGKSPLFKGPFSALDAKEVFGPCTVAFLALHGEIGEDGRFQGFLDTLGVTYNGSGVLASALAMNKITSKYLFLQCGLKTPPFSLFGKQHPGCTVETIAARHGFPCFVKCPQSGSSRLMGRAIDMDSLMALLDEFSPHADEVLIESAIKGIEFTCPVLEYPDGKVEALPPIEIRPLAADFFDYTAKYRDKGSEEICPAPRSPEMLEHIRETALKAHHALGCRGVSRTDMILKDNIFYVLEVNTLPGLTANSLLPKSFKAAGGSCSGLLDVLIQTACNRLPVKRP
jgi:D-alanine--D-alanine ligase